MNIKLFWRRGLIEGYKIKTSRIQFGRSYDKPHRNWIQIVKDIIGQVKREYISK